MTVKYQKFLNSGGVVLPPNQTMSAGDFLVSQNGRFALRLQSDGNLVLEEGGAVVWVANETQPYSSTFYRKKMREPLQFVVSNSGFLHDPARRRIWSAQSTETLDKSYWYNNYLTVTDAGNILIYDGRNGDVRWARLGFVPGRLPPVRKIVAHVYPPEPAPLWDWKHDYP